MSFQKWARQPANVCYLLLSVAAVSARATSRQTSDFPSCSWIENNYMHDNSAMIDTAANYWTFNFIVQANMSITIAGTFPNTRYVSLAVFDSLGGTFQTAAGWSSLLPDYEIIPDAGSINPWQQDGQPGGLFTVNLELPSSNGSKPVVDSAITNLLPLAPAGTQPGAAAQMTWRTYTNATANAPPLVTVYIGSTSQALPLCAAAGPTAPIASGPLPSPANVTFLRYPDTNVQANGDTAYLFAPVGPPANDTVLIIQGRAPRSSLGDSPSPWPTPEKDVQYWSLCNSVEESPFPVVVNGAILGCKHDEEFPRDAEDNYLAVIGTESQRATIEGITNAAFIPFSSDYPTTAHGLIFRHILSSNEFSQGIKRVTPGATLEATLAVMGDYYPRTAFCALETLKSSGPAACFA